MKKIAPAIAAAPTTPTTTPAAIAALLGPSSLGFSSAGLTSDFSETAVTTTVCPPGLVETWEAASLVLEGPLVVVDVDVAEALEMESSSTPVL